GSVPRRIDEAHASAREQLLDAILAIEKLADPRLGRCHGVEERSFRRARRHGWYVVARRAWRGACVRLCASEVRHTCSSKKSGICCSTTTRAERECAPKCRQRVLR